jgi:hypothetical protein
MKSMGKKNIGVEYYLDCDSSWLNKGKTIFSEKRIFFVK